MTAPPLLSKIPGFDPRLAPVLGVDDHLPGVPTSRLSAAFLRDRFTHPPCWTPEYAAEPAYMDRRLAQAAVLIGVVMHPLPTVLLTRRAVHLSTHSGQVAFPGGKVDPTDRDASHTALREAQEEVGLDPSHVAILGELSPYLTGSAFAITPVLALVEPGFQLIPNPAEVDEVFEVPLSFLMDPRNHRRHAHEARGVRREWLSMPYNDGFKEHFIWGATAGMLRNLYGFLSA